MASAERDPGKIREEKLALVGLFVNALVVDLGRLDRGARRIVDPPLSRAAIAHHQPLAINIALAEGPLDVVGDLGLKRGRDNLASTPTRELV